MSRAPIIKPRPTVEAYRRLVDELITPENADREAKAFIELIMTTGNLEDDDIGLMVHVAARHAFIKTEAFERAFREFAGWPDVPPSSADETVLSTEREM